MPTTLPISRLINVSVSLTPQAAQSQNISSLLILGTSPIIDTFTRMRSYSTLVQVANDFGTAAQEYLAASLWFAQSPQPVSLLIGRWANTASKGTLIGAPLTATNSLVATWAAISTGSLTVTVDATVKTLTALVFTGVTTLNGVASVITTALAGAGTMTYNSVFNRFELTSATTGATSLVSLATGSTGVNISTLLGMAVANTGVYTVAGIAPETALSAVTLFDSTFGQQWFAVMVPSAVSADHTAIAAYIEGASTYHVYGITSQDPNILVASDTTNIAYLLQQLTYKRTATQYSSTSPYAVATLFGRILTTDWNGNKTAITLMYKQEPSIAAENLNVTQITALEGFNANVFVAYNSPTTPIAIIEKGVCASGDYIDTVYGTAALAIGIQNAVFNALFTSPTKIAQTDKDMHILTTAVENVCAQFQTNGLLDAGTWTSQGFGALSTGDPMQKGYYVYAAPVSTQTSANRAARIAVPIQVAAKLAGAIHTVNVLVNVNN